MGAPSSGKRSRMDGETILLWVFITVVVLGVGLICLIFMVIVLDAFFAVFFTEIGWG